MQGEQVIRLVGHLTTLLLLRVRWSRLVRVDRHAVHGPRAEASEAQHPIILGSLLGLVILAVLEDAAVSLLALENLLL